MTTRYRFATPVRTPGRVTITHMPRSGRAGYSREHASKVIAEEIRKHSDSEA
jgi:hypothetical protein